MNSKIKFILVLAAVVLIYFGFRFITGPEISKTDSKAIDPAVEPVQLNQENPETVDIMFKDGNAKITLAAEYKIAAKVCGIKKYRLPWLSFVAPYDLCLMWGKLATEDINEYVSFSQDMRWYQFSYRKDGPYNQSYVATHSANTHLLYATDNLQKAASRLSEGDVVEMEGYLVKIKGTYKGSEVWWNSSMTRDDTGKGACEVFYIKSLKLGKRVYN